MTVRIYLYGDHDHCIGASEMKLWSDVASSRLEFFIVLESFFDDVVDFSRNLL